MFSRRWTRPPQGFVPPVKPLSFHRGPNPVSPLNFGSVRKDRIYSAGTPKYGSHFVTFRDPLAPIANLMPTESGEMFPAFRKRDRSNSRRVIDGPVLYFTWTVGLITAITMLYMGYAMNTSGNRYASESNSLGPMSMLSAVQSGKVRPRES